MIDRRTLIACGAAFAALPQARAEPARQGEPVRAVLELFTSQSCSSCPPADRLFQTLAREKGTLALTLPVTIWDHLGWKDTLAKTVFSERQKNYCRTRGDRNVYTPQAVVNGLAHVKGSDLSAIEAARRETQQQEGVLALLPVLEGARGRWQVALPASSLKGQVVLVTFDRNRTVRIGRGENSGREIHYANVVKSMQVIGTYAGAAVRIDLPAEAVADATQGFAVLVQDGDEKLPGTVYGAVESPRA